MKIAGIVPQKQGLNLVEESLSTEMSELVIKEDSNEMDSNDFDFEEELE